MNYAQAFLDYQSILHSIALRILKCKADAEDAVHDAFEKWVKAEKKGVANVKGYLESMITNICLNKLKKFSYQKEEPIELVPNVEQKKWVKEMDVLQIDKDFNMSKAVSIMHARLEPIERAIVLLREVFNYEYDALQEMLGKKADHCRKILSRAKEKLKTHSELNHSKVPKKGFMDAFWKACQTGNSSELAKYLKNQL